MERYAVDFGTSNTVVARWNYAKEQPQTLTFPAITAPAEGAMPPVTPSVLYYRGEDRFLMGYEVTSRGLDDIRSSRYFWGFKRGLLHLSSLYEERGREFSADHVARLFLTRLLGNLELNQDSIVTFTAPVNAFDTYREWISAFFAENYPGVPYRLVDESVAAAISYGSTRAGSVVRGRFRRRYAGCFGGADAGILCRSRCRGDGTGPGAGQGRRLSRRR